MVYTDGGSAKIKSDVVFGFDRLLCTKFKKHHFVRDVFEHVYGSYLPQ